MKKLILMMMILICGSICFASNYYQMDDEFIKIVDFKQSLNIGDTFKFTATNTTGDYIMWSSDNENIAKVDELGNVFALEEGTCNIICSSFNNPFIFDKIQINVYDNQTKNGDSVVIPVTGVTLNKTELEIEKGKTYTLKATVTPSDATNKSVTWSSSNSIVASVNTSGKITAKEAGEATITVKTKDGGYTATCDVTVIVPVTDVSLNKSSVNLKKGEKTTLKPSIKPTDATNKSVSWSSSNTSVATVSTSGVVTAKEGGVAKITCTTKDGSFKATCKVNVIIPVTGVSLNKTSLELYKGKNFYLKATVKPSNATNKTVNWYSSNKNAIYVNAEGKVDVYAPGTAIITCKTRDGGYTATCKVTYNGVTGITIDKTNITLKKGGATIITPTVTPENATNKTVYWFSSDPSIAGVGSTGKVSAYAPGKTTITAKTKDGAFKAYCKVTVVIPVSGIKLNKSNITINKGKSAPIKATVMPSNATNKTVIYSSSDESIATVDNTGRVFGKEVGSATIFCTTEEGGYTETCQVVVDQPVTGITLDKESCTILKGDSLTLNATVLPSDAVDKTVIWTTQDSNIATVSENGEVNGINPGVTTITATTNDGGYSASCEVTVYQPVSGLELDKDYYKLKIDETFTLNAIISPSDASNKDVIWSSSDESIATVSENGEVAGIEEGEALITCTTVDGGFEATCKVEVYRPVTGITLNPTSCRILKGNTKTLSATIQPNDATDKSVTWSSADSTVATVSSNGVVTGKKVGTTTITCTTNDGGYTATCSVEVYQNVTGLDLNKTILIMQNGTTEKLIATVLPEDASNKKVTWSSSRPLVANVGSDGKVTALFSGIATITCKTEDGGYTATCIVTVL